jgi:hypothetical protein
VEAFFQKQRGHSHVETCEGLLVSVRQTLLLTGSVLSGVWGVPENTHYTGGIMVQIQQYEKVIFIKKFHKIMMPVSDLFEDSMK